MFNNDIKKNKFQLLLFMEKSSQNKKENKEFILER